MTSNLGAQLIYERFENADQKEYAELALKTKEEVFELLRHTIKPEFLNRIDESIFFHPLSKNEIEQIVSLQLNELKNNLLESSIHLVVSQDAFEHIVQLGYDPFFGARPVKRVIQKEVLNELSKAILSQKLEKSQNVVMDMFDGKIVFRKPIHAHEELQIEGMV